MDGPPPLPEPEVPVPPPIPKKKTRSRWRIPLLVIGGIVAVIGTLVTMAFCFTWLAKEVPVRESDKSVLLRAEDFVPWIEDFEVDPTLETYTKIRNIDKSYELDYTYEADDLYLYCSIGVDTSESDARISYGALTAGLSIGAAFDSDVEYRERKLMTWGHQSKCALMHVEGSDAPVGNLFACREGKRTFLVIFGGFHFDDAEMLRELLEPVLERLSRYVP